MESPVYAPGHSGRELERLTAPEPFGGWGVVASKARVKDPLR